MATDISFSNVYMTYIRNGLYQYPRSEVHLENIGHKIPTGWQIIPTMKWNHFVTPKQFAELQINYEAIHVNGYKVTLFNMIPMMTQLSFGANQVWTSFNNTIYCLGYRDRYYETSWENWWDANLETKQPNLAQKEGMLWLGKGETSANNGSQTRFVLPDYQWKLPNARIYNDYTLGTDTNEGNANKQKGAAVFPTQGRPTGIFWDPLNRPDDLLEFRPGKNAITFNWECHACDSDKWFNLDAFANWWPHTAYGPYFAKPRPSTYKLTSEDDPDKVSTQYQDTPLINDYTYPNWAELPLVPCAWWWQEMRASIVQDFTEKKPDFFFPGTEYEQYKYPPEQCFIKMVPLIAEDNTTIALSAQISIKVELFLKAKPRRSAIYAPTWGPFNWEQLYSANINDQIYRPSLIRYRTGGARMTWQNMQRTANPSGVDQWQWAQAHAREDPYSLVGQGTNVTNELNSTGSVVAATQRSVYTMAPSHKPPDFTITISQDDPERTVKPKAKKRLLFWKKSPKDTSDVESAKSAETVSEDDML